MLADRIFVSAGQVINVASEAEHADETVCSLNFGQRRPMFGDWSDCSKEHWTRCLHRSCSSQMRVCNVISMSCGLLGQVQSILALWPRVCWTRCELSVCCHCCPKRTLAIALWLRFKS